MTRQAPSLEHALTTSSLPVMQTSAAKYADLPVLPVSRDRDALLRTRPPLRPRKGERSRFWFAELCGLLFVGMILSTLLGEHIEKMVHPLHRLVERHAPSVVLRTVSFQSSSSKPVVIVQPRTNALPKGIQDKKGFLCLKIPQGLPPATHIALEGDAPVAAGGDMNIESSQLPALLSNRSSSVASAGECGATTEDLTIVVILYHKMGTVWWQHILRVFNFANWESLFEVDSGDTDSMKFLELAAQLAAEVPEHRRRYPALIVMDNPTLQHVRSVYKWTRMSGRQIKVLLQVRDFRDVVISGYKYHKHHQKSDLTPEAWLHKPEVWWGEALGSNTPVSYQQALKELPLEAGAALEMDMVEEVWTSVAMISHDPEIAASTAFVKYEDLWAQPDVMFPKIARFLYGDARCNPSALRFERAALSYTAGFRTVSAALAMAAERGESLSASEVDISEVVDLLKGSGTRAESSGSMIEYKDFFATTYAHAGQHFRRGAPGNWKNDSAFSPEVAALFDKRYHCLLKDFRYDDGKQWLSEVQPQTSS